MTSMHKKVFLSLLKQDLRPSITEQVFLYCMFLHENCMQYFNYREHFRTKKQVCAPKL